MNILPKKRWHVRTKENIARVRKDEAEAAVKEKQEKLRIENADREARLNVLKQKSKQKLLELDIKPQISDKLQQSTTSPKHINLFSDLDHAVQTTNKDHDKELKEKKEEYEKKIGYLTYLGQDTNEALGKKNWYDLPPGSSNSSCAKDTYNKLVLKDEYGKPKKKEIDEKDGEVAWKAKQRHDPLNKFKQYCSKEKYESCKNLSKSEHSYKHSVDKKKKSKNNNYEQNEIKLKLQKLREARLKREQQEKYRTEKFLSKLSGTTTNSDDEEKTIKKLKPKYNSQFNPELARQNYRL